MSAKPCTLGSTSRAVGFCLLAVTLAFSGVSGCGKTTPLEAGLASLVEACNSRRLAELRLTGGFHAGEYQAPDSDSSGAQGSQLDQTLVQKANDEIAEGVSSLPDDQADFWRGLYLLAIGNASEATGPLRKAAQDLKADADAQNDYGAVLYQTGNYEDALDRFQQALSLKPNMPEALTNLGICYQKLLLMDQARNFFEQAIKGERDSTWRREIDDRLQIVSRPIGVAGPPDTKGALEKALSDLASASNKHDKQIAQSVLLGNYRLFWEALPISLPAKYLADRKSGNLPEAGNDLAQLKVIGSAFKEILCDSMGEAIADYLEKLPDNQLDLQLSLYSEESKLYSLSNKDVLEKAKGLEKLARQCDASGNHCLSCVARLRATYSYYYGQQSEDAIRLADSLLSDPDCAGWNDLHRNVLLQAALSHLGLGHLSEALRLIQESSSLCPTSHITDPKEIQYTGTTWEALGDLSGALDSLRKSTALYLLRGDSTDLAYNYLTIADIYRLQSRDRLALLFGRKALELFEMLGQDTDSGWVAQSASFTAERQAFFQDFDSAGKSLATAFAAAQKLQAEQVYTQTLVFIRAGRVALEERDTKQAVTYFQEAEHLASGPQGSISLAVNALRGLARADRLNGDAQQARDSLDQAVRLIENSRSGIIDSAHRTEYLDATHGVYEDLISLEAEPPLDDPEKAFDIAEESRGRTLLDQINSSNRQDRTHRSAGLPDSSILATARPVALSSLESALQPDLVLIEYSVTDDATYIFVVSKSGLKMVRSPAKTSELNGLVSQYVDLLETPNSSDAWKSPASRLYNALIQPVASFIPPGSTICIAPDRMLDVMSFAALLAPDGKYLISSNPLTYTPSASILKLCLDESRAYRTIPAKSVLAIGNPAFDRTKFPTLRPLPTGDEEAAQVESCYQTGEKLTGQQATESEVRKLITSADVVHLASHCLVDDSSPWRAELILARPSSGTASTENDGVLQLKEIKELNLHRTQLVVLSACQTAVGQYFRGEGLVSLVRPFIAARVPMVIASLWDVESTPTATLLVDFHQLYGRQHEAKAKALRDAQLRLAKDSKYGHPYFWASFIAVGS